MTATPTTQTSETSPAKTSEIVDQQNVEAEPEGAISVLRRGLGHSEVLRRGLGVTVGMGLATAVARLTVPVLIQRAIDRDPLPDGGFDVNYATWMAVAAAGLIIFANTMLWATQRRLVVRSEQAIADLRSEAFAKVHQMSVADHNETRRGALVARVTADADTLARFAQWGLFIWTMNPPIMLGTLLIITWYSWPLALVLVAVYAPIIPWFRWLQRRQLVAYDRHRTAVSDMLGQFSESLMGAAVVRAYGLQQHSRRKITHTITSRYRAQLVANKYMSGVFISGDILGAVATLAALGVGTIFRAELGLNAGELVAILFLISLLNNPVGQLGEVLDRTQTAVSGWRKILSLLDHPLDVIEPVEGVPLPDGALSIEARNVCFAYRDGDQVLNDVSITIPAGTNVAIVGETGSGKTTFAKLLARLADPTAGQILIGDRSLESVSPQSRFTSIRMVPQDGFLFNTSIRENVRFGAPNATDTEIDDAFSQLGLDWWVKQLPHGLDDVVGERGESLSVGERQLVALARAALADPGLLILDEATSSVDPETDQALTAALRLLAEGRTMVSVAHRLATAEAAELVLVFDRGRLVEHGHHRDLVNAGGRYSDLHQAWLGNTR